MSRIDGTGLPPLATSGAQELARMQETARAAETSRPVQDGLSFNDWTGLDATITATGRIVGGVANTAGETVNETTREVKDQADNARYGHQNRQYNETTVYTAVSESARTLAELRFDAPRVEPYIDRAPREPVDFPGMSGQVLGHVIDYR